MFTPKHATMKTAPSEQRAAGVVYPPLAAVTRTHVSTAEAAFHLNRKPQTLRGWHCAGKYPEGLEPPVSINGRLDWSVAGIRRARGMEA